MFEAIAQSITAKSIAELGRSANCNSCSAATQKLSNPIAVSGLTLAPFTMIGSCMTTNGQSLPMAKLPAMATVAAGATAGSFRIQASGHAGGCEFDRARQARAGAQREVNNYFCEGFAAT